MIKLEKQIVLILNSTIFLDDMGKRTNDPQYYYFRNDDFKVNWSEKYVKLYIIIGRANVSKIMFFYL